jgi:hypothetical protein
MMGSPELQPLMTVLGRTARGHPGLSARRKNRPNRNRVERLPTRHLVERLLRSASRSPKHWPVLAILRHSRSGRLPAVPSTCRGCRTRSSCVDHRYDHRLVGARWDSAMPSLARPWRAFMIDCVGPWLLLEALAWSLGQARSKGRGLARVGVVQPAGDPSARLVSENRRPPRNCPPACVG